MYTRVVRPPHPTDTVQSLMVWPVATVDVEASMQQVAEALAADEIGALAVMFDDNLVGVVSERDVVHQVAAGHDLEHVLARDVMSLEPVTVQSHASLAEAARIMHDAGVRHLPVLEGDLVAGFLSIRDLFDMYVAAPA